jgi:hypothetical protein
VQTEHILHAAAETLATLIRGIFREYGCPDTELIVELLDTATDDRVDAVT